MSSAKITQTRYFDRYGNKKVALLEEGQSIEIHSVYGFDEYHFDRLYIACKAIGAKVNKNTKRKEMEKFYGNKGDIAWGRQIRSYVLQPYTLVKDHRTDVEVGNVDAVLHGALEPFIESYLKAKQRHE